MRTARAQIPEFHATKMLFESHVGDTVEDPEGIVVQIDDLEAATKARTPQEELRRMRSLGGGIKLSSDDLGVAILIGHCCQAEMPTRPRCALLPGSSCFDGLIHISIYIYIYIYIVLPAPLL